MQGITDNEFNLIRDYMRDKYGISLTGEKRSLVYSRLKNLVDNLGLKNFTEYYNYLIQDKSGEATVTFIDKMTTNYTFFMREVNHFEYLQNIVLPYIYDSYNDKDLRIWCAGCSSGEESYTLQIILTEFFANKGNWDTQLLATDISGVALSKAIKGVYNKEQIKAISENWKNNYFKSIDEKRVQVTDKIKNKIVYRKFNLMQPTFPFKKKFQVIFCRNVMIYFDDEVRTKLVKKFYDASEKGAYLFIGNSETLNNIKTDYEYVMPSIYRKN